MARPENKNCDTTWWTIFALAIQLNFFLSYSIVAFEESVDIHAYDPLKTSFEYARKARSLANKFQDFNTEYLNIAGKCEQFSSGLLDKCTTKHEVQTLLQTKSYPGSCDDSCGISICSK